MPATCWAAVVPAFPRTAVTPEGRQHTHLTRRVNSRSDRRQRQQETDVDHTADYVRRLDFNEERMSPCVAPERPPHCRQQPAGAEPNKDPNSDKSCADTFTASSTSTSTPVIVPPALQGPETSTTRKRLRKAYVLPTRKYILMQPQKVPYRNPSCAACNEDLESREWRVRSETNYGESWHPRCFATAWPTIDIHCPPDTPPEISTLIQKKRPHPQPHPWTNPRRQPPMLILAPLPARQKAPTDTRHCHHFMDGKTSNGKPFSNRHQQNTSRPNVKPCTYN